MKTKTSNRILLAIIIIFAIFFATFKLGEIPPGTQNDILRSEITAEQLINGLDGDMTGLRQKIAYFILGGYWVYYLVDIFRTTQNFAVVNIIARLPSAIFMVLGAITWLRILREVKMKDPAIILFFLIMLPSSLFIVNSHFIPLVAAYFFYTSVSILYFIKAFQNKKIDYISLMISAIAVAASTYTHGISIFFSIIFFIVFTPIFFILKKPWKYIGREKVNPLHRVILGFLGTLAIIFVLLLPLITGYRGDDKSLQIRDATTIKYLIENDEVDLMKRKIIEKISAYLSPNTLVFSRDIIPGTQPINSSIFHDIKNPRFNQWVTTNLSPFGPITLLLYIIVPGLLFLAVIGKIPKQNRLAIALLFSLVVSYILVPIFPNYDNPSVAKMITALMFIPLGISIIANLIANHKPYMTFLYLLIVTAILNSAFNLSYLYSSDYQKWESEKYYIESSLNLVQDATEGKDLNKLRIYLLSYNPDLQNVFSYFLSPNILNRIVLGDISPDALDPREHNILIATEIEQLKDFKIAGLIDEATVYKKANGVEEYYLAETLEPPVKTRTTAPVILGKQNISCSHQLYYPTYTGEFEYLLYEYKYYPNIFQKITLEECNDTSLKTYSLFSPMNFIIKDGVVKTSFAPNQKGEVPTLEILQERELKDGTKVRIEGGDITYKPIKLENVLEDIKYHTGENSFYRDDMLNLISGQEAATASIELSTESLEPGTYVVSFNYSVDDYGYLDIFMIDRESSSTIPTNLPLQHFYQPNESYSTAFYLEPNSTAMMGLILHNRHYNVDKGKHSVKAGVSDFDIYKVADVNLLEQTIEITPIKDFVTNVETPVVKDLFPGITKIEWKDLTRGTIVLNSIYSRNLHALRDNKTTTFTMSNGIGQAIQFSDLKQNGQITIINTSWIKGGTLLFIFIALNTLLITFDLKERPLRTR